MRGRGEALTLNAIEPKTEPMNGQDCIPIVRRSWWRRDRFAKGEEPCVFYKCPETHRRCARCGLESLRCVVRFRVNREYQRIGNLTGAEVWWCSNADCDARLAAYGDAYVHTAVREDGELDPSWLCLPVRQETEESPVTRSKLGGIASFCATEPGDNEEILATFWGGDLHRLLPAFPDRFNLMLSRTNGELGYCVAY